MKLHLPFSLRKALFALFAVAAVQNAMASSMSTYVSQAVYADFGDNAGLYSVHGVNDLLKALRAEEKGVFIYYSEGSNIPKYNILQYDDQPLISFESRMDSGPAAAVSYNFLATVEHNGVQNPTFTGTKIGDSNAIHYYGIEYRKSGSTAEKAPFEEMNIFRLVPQTDFKITRLSKIVTDVSTYDFNTNHASTYKGEMWYRSGSGSMYHTGEDGQNVRWGGAYSYNVGGLMTISDSSDYANYGTIPDYRGIMDTSGSVLTTYRWWLQADIAGTDRLQPLPFAIQSGDSGSPTWIYDQATQTYLYSGAMQSANGSTLSQARYAGEWAKNTEKYFNVDIALEGDETITVKAASEQGEGYYDPTNNVKSNPYVGTVEIQGKEQALNYVGVNSTTNTWNSLSSVKDKLNWFNYGNDFLNSDLTYADLFYTNNLVFNGKGGQEHSIVVEGNVDTGIGYARFVNTDTEGNARVSYTIKAQNGDSQLNTAGFVVEKNVDLIVELTGKSGTAREWRKIGEGDMYIKGEGNNNDILLNLGGSGTTYLQRENGYAAYNVLANNGTRVVIDDTQQIYRDFTFGFGGATLDMNGQSMNLVAAETAKNNADMFSIHALTQEAVITNGAGENVALTWKETEWDGNNQATFEGSFKDQAGKGALQFIYDADGHKLTLHSIYTDLHNEGSGITVQSGTLALQGTVTQHAPGSQGVAFSSAKLVNNDDWHYADMTTPVTVNGGTFELGSHARLKGLVTVNEGGIFVMREGVTHQYEYLEGYYTAKNTDNYREFFGLKGDVQLQSGAEMQIKFNDKVDSTLVYEHSIKGDGKLVIDPGVYGGSVTLSGNNLEFRGEKVIQRGGVTFGTLEALGNVDTNKWKLIDSGFMTSEKFEGAEDAAVLHYIDGSSTGILALTEENREQLNLENHKKLIIGAAEGKVVQYGEKDTTDTLTAWDGNNWHLGGGGGELVVNYKLTGNSNLVLGSEYAQGSVYLTNTTNDFSGDIIFAGGVTLKYDSDAVLGSASFTLNYTNRVAPVEGLSRINEESKGVLLLDRMNADTLNLTAYKDLALGTSEDREYTGTIQVAANADYRFGGSSALLSLKQGLQVNGTNGLKLDGQTYSGGEIRLDAQTQITGDVEVRGYDQTATTPECRPVGDITLGLGVEDAIAHVASVTLKDGGYLDLHGHSQSINNLAIEDGGALKDSGKGTLNLNLTKSVTWRGSVETGTINVTATNGSTLTMAGTANYDEMRIKSGSNVALGANNSLSVFGTTIIEKGGNLNMNGHSAEGNIIVNTGGTLSASGSSAASVSGYVTLDGGTMSFAGAGSSMIATSTLVSNGGVIQGNSFHINGLAVFQNNKTYLKGLTSQGGIYFGGTVEIENGASLVLQDTEFFTPIGIFFTNYTISSTEFNISDRRSEDGTVIPNTGSLRVETRDLRLGSDNQEFGGIVELADNTTHEIKISAERGTKTFDTLQMNIATVYFDWRNPRNNQYEGSKADWIIHHLQSGEQGGNIVANLQQEEKQGHYVKLDGKGTFNKTLTVNGGTLVLAAENAMPNGVVNLAGGASLAVNTATTQVRGLVGTEDSSLYAGAESDKASTRNGTLVIAPESEQTFTYAGSVLSEGEYGVSIVKEGAGTQNFSGGSTVNLRNVTVNSGSLAFNHETVTPNISGNITIAQGGTLDLKGKTLSLGTGQTLAVTGTGETPAKLVGSLSFDGGKLQFSGSTLAQAEGRAVLQLTSATQTQQLLVHFGEERSLEAGKGYQLSTGDWSGVENIETDSMIYYTAAFTHTGTGLSVTFSDRQDIQVWDGKTSESYWNGSNFGQQDNLLDGAKTAVFNDTADSTGVAINADQVVKEMVFDNDAKKYALVTGGSYVVQAETIRQVGKETTELSGKIQVESATVEAGTLSLVRGSSVKEDVAVAESATLNLGVDSSVKDVQVAEGGTVVVRDYQAVTGGISGDGTIQVNWSDTEKHSLNFKSIGTLEVQSGSVDMTEQGAQMNILHVKNGAVYSNDSQKEHYAHKAIVDEGGRLETSIGDYTTSGLVSNLEGKGTVVLVAGEKQVDLGDHAVTGGIVGASAFTGTLQLGDGENEFRFRSTNVTGLGAEATIELQEKAQYWAGNGDATVQANLVLHGDSASSAGSSWNGEGFGAVRGVSNFNGTVTIDGNAMVSGTANIAFNADIKGEGDNATLTFGGYHSSEPAQTYTLAEGMKTEGLANMVVRLSGGKTTTVNVNSKEGLADNLKFESKVAGNGSVNVNASNSIQRLESAAGDGVVNIAQGKSLELTKGAKFGGQLNLAQDVTITATSDGVTLVTGGVKFASGAPGSAGITGADGTRIDSSIIDLAAGTRLEMANVTLGAHSHITDDTAALVANGLVVDADILANLKPLTYGDAAASPVDEPADMVSFTLSNIDNVLIYGKDTGLVVRMVGDSAQSLSGKEWMRLGLGGEGQQGQFADGLNVTLQYEDATGLHSVQGVYTLEDVEVQAAAEEAAMNHEFVYFHLSGNVPEPATGTLGLLALAALAARRRRK